MSKKANHSIVIWDQDPGRIHEIHKNLQMALQEIGVEALITSESEPPRMAREGVLGKEPLLEIGGLYWSLSPGKSISLEASRKLLFHIFKQSREI